jgi:hypothetical protein
MAMIVTPETPEGASQGLSPRPGNGKGILGKGILGKGILPAQRRALNLARLREEIIVSIEQ